MTPLDVQALEAFLNQLTQARVDTKDPQAAAMIANAAARQPDTAYLLVQRSMLLDRALQQAQTQIQSLQAQLQAAQAAGGTRGFMDNDNAWGNSVGRAPQAVMPSPAPAPTQYQASQYPAAPQYPSPQYQAAPAQPARGGFLSGGLGGTLGTIATTAAGVAGGALLFQGVENLFHRGSNGGGFFGGGNSERGAAPTETVVNNFYGDDNGAGQRDNTLLADNGNLDNGLDDYINDNQDDDSSFF